jgi:MFS superfamily sulfate permease-like transporter
MNTAPNATATQRETIATTLSLLVGLLTFLFGLARFGFVDSVMSRALLRGFITAVACVIVIEQLPSLLGITEHDANEDENANAPLSPFMKLLAVACDLGRLNWCAALLSTVSVAFLVGVSHLKKHLSNGQEKECHTSPTSNNLPRVTISTEDSIMTDGASSATSRLLDLSNGDSMDTFPETRQERTTRFPIRRILLAGRTCKKKQDAYIINQNILSP